MIFEIISGGEKTDWVGKEWAGLFFPRGKNGPAHFFPGEKLTGGKFRPVTAECLSKCIKLYFFQKKNMWAAYPT